MFYVPTYLCKLTYIPKVQTDVPTLSSFWGPGGQGVDDPGGLSLIVKFQDNGGEFVWDDKDRGCRKEDTKVSGQDDYGD